MSKRRKSKIVPGKPAPKAKAPTPAFKLAALLYKRHQELDSRIDFCTFAAGLQQGLVHAELRGRAEGMFQRSTSLWVAFDNLKCAKVGYQEL